MSEEQTFDIRNALLGRKYPSTSVKVNLTEEHDFKIASLERRLSTETNEADVKTLEKHLAKALKDRDAEAYTIHLKGVSNRNREELWSKSLHEFPIKRDVYGREDEINQVARQSHLQELIFTAYITKIEDPQGRVQDLTVLGEDGRRDVVRALRDEAPRTAIALIDQAINVLSREFQVQQAEELSADF